MITDKAKIYLRQKWWLIRVVALICILIAFHGRFRLAMVVGDSMLPTLKSGNLLLVDKRAYVKSEPRRGDIVVARYAKDWIVKRIVGLPGEEIEVRRGTLYVDGTPSRENHKIMKGSLDVAKGRLLDGDFASLGDNRAVPSILAVHPILSKPDILGKVVFASGQKL